MNTPRRVLAGLAAGWLVCALPGSENSDSLGIPTIEPATHAISSAPDLLETDRIAEILPLFRLLSGELKGELTTFPGRPISWRLALADDLTAGAGAASVAIRKGELSVTGPDLDVRVTLTYEPAARRLRWSALQGRANLATWLPALATLPDLASMLEGVTASGSLTLTGAGTWTDGTTTGGLRVELANGAVHNETEDWALDGITLNAGGDTAGLVVGNVPLELTVGTITTARFGARALTVNARVQHFERIELTAARIEIAGGEVTAEPFSVAVEEPVLEVTLTMRGVGLEDIVALVPEALAEGRGHVNGSVRLGWSRASGVTIKHGSVSLADGKPALVRFHPNLGLLTGSLPAAILDLYPGLLKIETGEMPLLAARFDVRLTPDGDADGRTARVRIEGGPVDPSLKAPLVLDVNVTGPLAPLIKLGSGVSLGTTP